MKKAGIWLSLISLLALAACGGGSSGQGEAGGSNGGQAGKQTVTWWVPNWDEAVARELAAEFEAVNEDIQVDIVITTWDTMENKIRVALMTKDAPDVITELESRVQSYAAQSLLENLDSFYDDQMPTDDFITSALEINTHEDSLYGVPFRHDGSGILYNKGMFREAGLDPEQFPLTWDELLAASDKLTRDSNGDGKTDQYAMAWPLGNQANAVTRYTQLLFSEEGDIYNGDATQSLLNQPEAVEALKKMTDTFKTGMAPRSSMELDNTSLRDLFINEKIALYIGGQFDIEPIQENNPSIELGTAVIPGPDGMGVTTADGFSLIVPESAKHKEAARKLIHFIAQPENMGQLTATFPGRKSALELPEFNDPLLKPFSDQLERGQTKPNHKNWTQIEKIIYRYLQLVVLENMDVQEAADKMAAEVDAELK